MWVHVNIKKSYMHFCKLISMLKKIMYSNYYVYFTKENNLTKHNIFTQNILD